MASQPMHTKTMKKECHSFAKRFTVTTPTSLWPYSLGSWSEKKPEQTKRRPPSSSPSQPNTTRTKSSTKALQYMASNEKSRNTTLSARRTSVGTASASDTPGSNARHLQSVACVQATTTPETTNAKTATSKEEHVSASRKGVPSPKGHTLHLIAAALNVPS